MFDNVHVDENLKGYFYFLHVFGRGIEHEHSGNLRHRTSVLPVTLADGPVVFL